MQLLQIPLNKTQIQVIIIYLNHNHPLNNYKLITSMQSHNKNKLNYNKIKMEIKLSPIMQQDLLLQLLINSFLKNIYTIFTGKKIIKNFKILDHKKME